MNCWAVPERTISALHCAKNLSNRKDRIKCRCVALICVFISSCCKNTSLSIQWLKTVSMYCLQTWWLNIQVSLPGLPTTVHTVTLKMAVGRALVEDQEAAAAISTPTESRIQFLGTEKLFHFLGCSGAGSLAFHPPSLHPWTPLSFSEAAIACRPPHAESLLSSSTTPVWLKLSSTPLFYFKAS